MNQKKWLRAVLAVLIGCGCVFVTPLGKTTVHAVQAPKPGAQTPTGLSVGAPLEKPMAGGEQHLYQVRLRPSQLLQVTVVQKGIDVLVQVSDPQGKQLVEVDSPYGPRGPEIVKLIADSEGEYRLLVGSFDNTAKPGSYRIEVTEVRDASESDQRRISARIKAQNLVNEAISLNEKRDRSSIQAALAKYAEAIEQAHLAGETEWEAEFWNSIGRICIDANDFGKALEACTKAQSLIKQVNAPLMEASITNNLGFLHRVRGEMELALQAFQQALKAVRAEGDKFQEGIFLDNIGFTLQELGQPQAALEHHLQALPLHGEMGNRQGESVTLNNIGTCYQTLRNYEQAVSYLQKSLEVMQLLKNRDFAARITLNLSSIQQALGKNQAAREQANQALQLARELKNRPIEARALSYLGGIAFEQGDLQEALAKLTESYNLLQTLQVPPLPSHFQQLATVEYKLKRLEEARTHIETFIERIEFTRAQTANPDYRLSYFAGAEVAYGLYVDILMELHRANPTVGYDRLALQASEQARARALVDLLSEAKVTLANPEKEPLVAEEQALERAINVKNEKLIRLSKAAGASRDIQAEEKELTGFIQKLKSVKAQIRSRDPHYAALTQPVPVTVADLQAKVLDADTMLLEYRLGEERSWLWMVTATGISSFELPRRAVIEQSAREVYQLLTAYQRKKQETDRQYLKRTAAAEAGYWPAAATLSRMLLTPVADQLGTKRLLVVADGALQYIPFAALPEPHISGTEPQVQPVPLLAGHEIVTLPSAASLLAVRQELSRRTPASKDIAIWADPVFELDDPRVKASTLAAAAPPPVANLERNFKWLTETRGVTEPESYLGRLAGTRAEAGAIANLAPTKTARLALDFEANREHILAGDWSDYRCLHFATHGFLNSAYPELSGLVWSLVSRDGKVQNGFLQIHDVYRLRLKADLVVLSGCETGLGKEIKAEGLDGLTRGFMYAGAPRIISSLWSVNDAVTADLMKRFYRSYWQEAVPPAKALRRAQLALWERNPKQNPSFWAGFVFQGEWK
ncbi:MAG: CHAT domain-containing protein [Blastocatellia bacterium]|nr:CHAT domain-containing protein [Blastocatellia bacterium]